MESMMIPAIGITMLHDSKYFVTLLPQNIKSGLSIGVATWRTRNNNETPKNIFSVPVNVFECFGCTIFLDMLIPLNFFNARMAMEK